jgi:CRP/FNR family transcriptional regulator
MPPSPFAEISVSDHHQFWVQHYPRLAASANPVLQNLRQSARLVRLPANHLLFRPGSPCGQYLLLTEGCVKVQLLTASGREVLLYKVHPGHACILTTSCLMGQNRYPAEGITEQPTAAFAINQADFQQALQQSDFFRQFVFCDFAERLGRVMARMEELVSGDIDSRLIRVLLEVSDCGVVHRTHQQLALETGTVREVVSRHLKRYREQGWIRLGRSHIILLDVAAMKAQLNP